jgi:hypothetical protein
MAELGIKPGIPPQFRDPRRIALHLGAITVTFLSGACALVALAVGSPLQFGAALALCGAGWIAADFIESTVEHQPAAHRCAVVATTPNCGYGSGRVVHIGDRKHFPLEGPHVGNRLAA